MAWIYHRRGGYQPPAGIVPCQRADNIRPYKLLFAKTGCLSQPVFLWTFAVQKLIFSISSRSSPKSCRAELTGAGLDMSTPAIFSSEIGSVLLPPERNFL